jgi:hypothetical protein
VFANAGVGEFVRFALPIAREEADENPLTPSPRSQSEAGGEGRRRGELLW